MYHAELLNIQPLHPYPQGGVRIVFFWYPGKNEPYKIQKYVLVVNTSRPYQAVSSRRTPMRALMPFWKKAHDSR